MTQLPISLRLVLVAMLTLLGAGCGRGNLPELGYVSGRITLDGNPVKEAHIEFTPVADGRPSAATSDSAGYYVLFYKGSVKGARLGEHDVTMTTFREAMTYVEDTDEDEPADANIEDSEITIPGRPEEIPAKYFEDPLTVTVAEGSNTIDLTLDSDG